MHLLIFIQESRNHYSLDKVNAEIGADMLLRSNNFNEMTGAITAISFSSGELTLGYNIITLGEGRAEW